MTNDETMANAAAEVGRNTVPGAEPLLSLDAATYAVLAKRTEGPVSGSGFLMPARLQHAISGLVTETGELAELHLGWRLHPSPDNPLPVLEEFGDACWYLQLGCDVYADVYGDSTMTFASAWAALPVMPVRVDVGQTVLRLVVAASILEDERKRATWYGKTNPERVRRALLDYRDNLARLMSAFGVDPGQVFAMNVNKLRRRFPEKFTTDAAVNRDVAAEYRAMGATATPGPAQSAYPLDSIPVLTDGGHRERLEGMSRNAARQFKIAYRRHVAAPVGIDISIRVFDIPADWRTPEGLYAAISHTAALSGFGGFVGSVRGIFEAMGVAPYDADRAMSEVMRGLSIGAGRVATPPGVLGGTVEQGEPKEPPCPIAGHDLDDVAAKSSPGVVDGSDNDLNTGKHGDGSDGDYLQ